MKAKTRDLPKFPGAIFMEFKIQNPGLCSKTLKGGEPSLSVPQRWALGTQAVPWPCMAATQPTARSPALLPASRPAPAACH